VRERYMHSDIDTLQRVELLRDLRKGEYDVLIGINLLREGLDIPEVSLVAILDADKEGFLRSRRSLIQTIGRAARNVEGQVILYADRITDSMRIAIDETERRRVYQAEHNEKHGITPRSVTRGILRVGEQAAKEAAVSPAEALAEAIERLDVHSMDELNEAIKALRQEMRAFAESMDYERATQLRDRAQELEALRLKLL
jgi:excinuclease ABC subunit B